VQNLVLALAALAFAFSPAAFSTPATVSQLIGTPVFDGSGDEIGEVKDVVFDARDGAIVALTVEYGRWLRVASHEAAFLPGDFERRPDGLVLRLPAQALRRTPPLGWASWPALRASYVMGREVRDRLRRDSGVMVDLAIDFAEMRISSAIIDLRDEWEERERLLRLPFPAVSFPREFGDFPTLRVRREQLGAGK
jgi:hypothetical protein